MRDRVISKYFLFYTTDTVVKAQITDDNRKVNNGHYIYAAVSPQKLLHKED